MYMAEKAREAGGILNDQAVLLYSAPWSTRQSLRVFASGIFHLRLSTEARPYLEIYVLARPWRCWSGRYCDDPFYIAADDDQELNY